MPKKRKKTSSSHDSTNEKHEHHEHHITVNVPSHTVAKKTTKKRKPRTTRKHTSHVKHNHKPSNKGIEHQLLENMVSLQKVQTDLTEKFDHLGKELTRMLALFELAARNFAKNAPLGEYEKDKEFLDKMDKLLDQNKILAKGLTMMEDHLRERMYGQSSESPANSAEKKAIQKPANPADPFEPSMATSSNRRPLPHF